MSDRHSTGDHRQSQDLTPEAMQAGIDALTDEEYAEWVWAVLGRNLAAAFEDPNTGLGEW